MCRHFAYVGRPRTLRELLLEPPLGLHRQAWQPRLQGHGTVNADGFGVGWWAGDPARPVRYRRDIPLWGDPNVPELASVTSSGAVLAAVRSATPGTAPGVESAAPFSDGRRLFSHNGRIDRWPSDVVTLVDDLPSSELLHLVARTDSALLWLLVQREVARGRSESDALASVAVRAQRCSSGRYNMLLHDGETIVATSAGDTLFTHQDDDGVTVASEPSSTSGSWQQVPDQSVVVATSSRVEVQPLERTAS